MNGILELESAPRFPPHLDAAVGMEELSVRLKDFHQEHLLQFWETLSDDQQSHYAGILKGVDFKHVAHMFQQTQASSQQAAEAIDRLMQPVPEDVYGGVNRNSPDELAEFWRRGLEVIANGEVAVVLLAGGQGTRLGVNYPKGMYNVGLPSGKSLYQIQAERILRLQELAAHACGKRGTVPWYIMTSEHTRHTTDDFFARHGYFGLDASSVVLFEQEMLPCFDFEGKIILEKPNKFAAAPGGNGGLYRALLKEGVLADMDRRGIKYVHVFGVDNILVKVADPHFLGYCVAKGLECGNKVVQKTAPNEAVGVVCLVNGVWQVVEYSEILPETAQKHLPDGSLMFNAGNIANHFFTLDFLHHVCNDLEPQLKYHIAKKKIPHLDAAGHPVIPTKPNGIKMEKFVFDVFQFARKFAVWEVIRKDEFAPLKNADDAADDTPTTARRAIFDLHSRYIEAAGGSFVDQTDRALTNGHAEHVVCEISPLVSYAGEGLADIVQGKRFESPLSLTAAQETLSRL
ncbi:UDP-N-acetylhexosamine pyrophosphorylase [Hypsibius exemplaris]|uniref:UDP-N-acetylglucosamine diphosphorylase n=1 Tax=Hypsibius exemplaris TaxID=2072580 RepID=A0A9X6NDV1_HYPEX|nr:UDP-N-acetylhexosamine pyrophosphorylase [Hypsibius exemplaris]